MDIEFKISKKPVNYNKALKLLEKRVSIVKAGGRELVWFLEHPTTYTAGIRSKKDEILDKSINVIKTNRGGKVTFHGKGQIIFYFVINLNSRKKDIRWFINIIEKSIIFTLKEFGINSFNDKENIGIWINHNSKIKKIAAIGIKIKKWIAYHGFAINYSVNLNNFSKIIPCGIDGCIMTKVSEYHPHLDSYHVKLIVKKFIESEFNLKFVSE